jgi:hypothetical protein
MTEIDFTLSADRQTVTITFKTDPPATVTWPADAVDDMLRVLRDIRMNMAPAVVADLTQGQVTAVQDPRWVTEPDLLLGDSLLHLRDPGYGWLHYMIPRHEAHRLAEFLRKQADSPAQGLGTKH